METALLGWQMGFAIKLCMKYYRSWMAVKALTLTFTLQKHPEHVSYGAPHVMKSGMVKNSCIGLAGGDGIAHDVDQTAAVSTYAILTGMTFRPSSTGLGIDPRRPRQQALSVHIK